MLQELRNRERRNNNSRLYLNRGYNPNVCRLYNKYCYVPLFSFVLFFFLPLCRYHLMAVLRSIIDEATTSRKQLDPLPSQLSHKKEERKKKIHNAETHIRELQSSINMIKIFVLLTIMDITQSVDILGLSAKLHQMTEDNSSWFGILLGKPWLWIKEIAILLLFLLLAYYLCIHSIKCFFQQMTPASHEEMTVPTRKDYYP